MNEAANIWSPAMVTAVVSGLVALVGAFTAMFVSLASLRKKADQIHDVTNAHLSEVTNALKVSQTKLEGLERLIGVEQKNKEAANVVATLAAQAAPPVPPPAGQ